ncbi:MAG: [Clostridia bacterium]|nr:[citrate (pro-3S)-lyase] ligase [Clostridia bacterium]
MEIELCTKLAGRKLNIWKELLEKASLEADLSVEKTVLVWDDEVLIATGSRQENILKCIAVDENHRGEDLTATVLSELQKDAFLSGYSHLFLYTKPHNWAMFTSLFFYEIAKTDKVLLMENRKNGIKEFLDAYPRNDTSGKIGSIVMNANPFTLGHRYLVETAAKECDRVYVFVLSEDKSEFSFEDRFNLVKAGTSDIPNVTVIPTGPYLISSATFPTYFLKERDSADEAKCALDIEVFANHFAPHFGITHRYIGTEPISKMTDMYNKALIEKLPEKNIEVKEISRVENTGEVISASRVRALIKEGEMEKIKELVPKTTYAHITGGLL